MIRYLRKDTKNGRTMYFKNGKMVSATDIPNSIVLRLENGVEITVDTPNPETVDPKEETKVELPKGGKVCIFCGEEATKARFINLETIQLCNEDYLSHTTGEIVQRVEENRE